MTRQLSTMINSGIPLLESLEILEEQASDPGFKIVLDKVIERVTEGKGVMPSFKGQLTESQIRNVAAFVSSATRGSG
jgi:type II secretory pathway component PulF